MWPCWASEGSHRVWPMLEQRSPLDSGTPSIAGLLPLELRHLSFETGGRRLVDRIDLKVQDRGITVILGPNGAGKSLLLRLMHGLIEPTEGVILWGNAPMDDKIRRRQAMVFQKPVLLRRTAAA